MAGHVFNNASNFDNTMNIILSIVLIGITVLFILFFVLQVPGLLAGVLAWMACVFGLLLLGWLTVFRATRPSTPRRSS